MSYIPVGEITTKDPRWLRARSKLRRRQAVFDVADICALFDIDSRTASRWARLGRLGARRATSAPQAAWIFDIDKIRQELGMEPLPPDAFSPDRPRPELAKKRVPRRGR